MAEVSAHDDAPMCCPTNVADSGFVKEVGSTHELESTAEQASADPEVPKKGQRLSLLGMPMEILQKIFKMLRSERDDCDDGVRDITVMRNGRWFKYGRPYPQGIAEFHGLLRWCPEARDLVGAIIGPDFIFVSHESEPLTRLHMVLGRASCSMINHLDVSLDDFSEHRPEQVTPMLLFVCCQYMPNLTKFKLTTEYYHPHIERTAHKRRRSAYAIMLRLMAFLVLRHHNLHRLVCPADSNPKYDETSADEHGRPRTTDSLQAEKGYRVRPGDSSRVWGNTTLSDSPHTIQGVISVGSSSSSTYMY